MDRSMDSIGSCSLDVDAESSDISDTSGSLNFPTPISIKDITREFTNNIRERCSAQTVKNNTTAYVDPVTGQVCIALTTPPTTTVNNNICEVVHSRYLTKSTPITKTPTTTTTALLSPQTPEDSYDKKPSYLNLACCVNGYSNITTYDSKIRQDINKSREVSPIRPSSSSLQYCKKSNSLAPPVLLAMPNVNLTSPQQQQQPSAAHAMSSAANGVYGKSSAICTKYSIIENNNYSQNGLNGHNASYDGSSGDGGRDKRSFIQQRVERLYGPGALAQGFYSPKKLKDSSSRLNKSDVTENGGDHQPSELARKFQELSPSKDYNQFRKKISNDRPPIPPSMAAAKEESPKVNNNNIDLPCLRHLSSEFRAQLPVVSPKRNFSSSSPGRDTIQPQTHTTAITNGTYTATETPSATAAQKSDKLFEQQLQQQQHKQNTQTSVLTKINSSSSPILGQDELDRKVVIALHDSDIEVLEKLLPTIDEPKVVLPTKDVKKFHSNEGDKQSDIQSSTSNTNGSLQTDVKDAHFFLKQLKDEQCRLLVMAAEAEKYLDALASNPDITEDTLGLLRSASGKARLLVSQKMKQFEGLCHNNLNSSPEDQYPTTVDDLQGFWDMVYLQVDHVDSIFADIENLKNNDWRKPVEDKAAVSGLKASRVSKTPFSNKIKLSTQMTNGAADGAIATPTAAALKREAQRKKLQEMKRRNREAMAAASVSTNITQESSAVKIMGTISTKETISPTDIQPIS